MKALRHEARAAVGAPLTVPIHTARLCLREFLARDLAAVRRYALDPAVLAHVLRDVPTDAELRAQFNRMLRARRTLRRRAWELAVVRRRSGKVIGTCELVRLGPSEAEIGYMLVRSYWGRGYGTEIAGGLADAGFAALPIERIRAIVHVGHESSRRVLEKAGFVWCARLPRHAHAKERWWDCDEYELHRADLPHNISH